MPDVVVNLFLESHEASRHFSEPFLPMWKHCKRSKCVNSGESTDTMPTLIPPSACTEH